VSAIEALTDRGHWPELARELGAWLPRRRWFQGKARTVADVAVVDVGVLDGEPPVAVVFAAVTYRRGAAERYQIPLAPGDGPLTVAGRGLVDALEDAGGALTIATRALSTAAAATISGARIHGAPVGDPPAIPRPARPLRAEQSNTSVVFGDALLLKVFRKLESGLNPDVEVTRALTEAGFAHVPPQAAALLLEGAGGSSALAVLSTFRAGARDAWDVATAEVAAARGGTAPPPLAGGAEELGRVVGALHRVLAQEFGCRGVTPADVATWVRAMHAQVDAVLATVAERPGTGGDFPALVDPLRSRIDRLQDLGDLGAAVRIHGDLHLGQVLADETHGWQVLDFEGEPARPLAERRRPHSPSRDVAGMLRSFDYAAAHGAPGEAQSPAAVARWRDEGRDAFLAGYLEVCDATGLLPRDRAAQRALLEAFELDKAVYEVGYELANRPAWVQIPLAGILRLLDPDTVSPSIRPQEGAA
jgi:maltokinase